MGRPTGETNAQRILRYRLEARRRGMCWICRAREVEPFCETCFVCQERGRQQHQLERRARVDFCEECQLADGHRVDCSTRELLRRTA